MQKMKCFPSWRQPHNTLQHIIRSQSTRSNQRIAYISTTTSTSHSTAADTKSRQRPLAVLPLSQVLRGYLVMLLSSSPVILNSLTAILKRMLASKLVLFDVERNPVLRVIFRRTFYAQFCAGDTRNEIQQMTEGLHKIGYHGVVLEYANEVLEDGPSSVGDKAVEVEWKCIQKWRDGLLMTIEMVGPGDFIAMKWSGMGVEAFRLLKAGLPPSEPMLGAMTAVCDAAAHKGVNILPAAEEQVAQPEVDQWTLDLAKKYNALTPGHAVIYNTYQCYLKSTANTLSKHLRHAADNGFTLGVKLVRGAYLGSEKRNLIWDTKDETDQAYDSITEELLNRRYGTRLQGRSSSETSFPSINLMLATHNLPSVQKARKIRDLQSQAQRDEVPLTYAQLQGMADEVSCELLEKSDDAAAEVPKTLKYSSWGSMKECMNYLLRRAAENRDAMSRTLDTRRAFGYELRQRFFRDFLAAGRPLGRR